MIFADISSFIGFTGLEAAEGGLDGNEVVSKVFVGWKRGIEISGFAIVLAALSWMVSCFFGVEKENDGTLAGISLFTIPPNVNPGARAEGPAEFETAGGGALEG